MNFDDDSVRWHTIHFYKGLIKLYNQELIQLENGQSVNKGRFMYQDHVYSLETIKKIKFVSDCQEHQWSYDKSNYRCICCGQWRTLEPIQIELPKEILLQIFSLRTPTINKELRQEYLWANAWSLLLKMKYNYPPHFCRLMEECAAFVCVVFKSTQMTCFLSGYFDGKRDNPLSGNDICVKGAMNTVTDVPAITAFIISVWSRLNLLASKFELDKTRLSKICLRGIRAEFSKRILGEELPPLTKKNLPYPEGIKQLFSIAYKECSLICFGFPQEIVHLFSIEDTIQIFEQALSKSQLRLPSNRIVNSLEKAIENKHLLDTGRGLMLLWFAKQAETETGQHLRQKAIAIFL